MTKRKKGSNEVQDKTIKTKSKTVSAKSQKQKKPVEKEVKSLKEEDLIQESITDSEYDGDSLSGSLNSDDFFSDVFDSEGDDSQNETDDGDDLSSEDELLHDPEGSSGNDEDDKSELIDSDNNVEDESDEGSEPDEAVEESDSSEDEVASINTVGDDPLVLELYTDEKHIGYDITGKKITKKEKQDKIDSFLATTDDSKNWRKICDGYNDEEVELEKEEIKLISRVLKGEPPHADFDPYPPYVDWFNWGGGPLSSAPEPKRRFIDSTDDAKKVVKYVRAIRKGLIKFDNPEEESNVYHLWDDDSMSAQKSKHLTYIPPPKLKLPGHEESYNPSLEYIPTDEEKASYELMDPEDRPNFIPKRFTSLRIIPAYENALKECFERGLDLYLCPRIRKKRINIDPESLKPKLPNKKDLRPYPNSCYLEYKGHTGAVTSISTDSSGEWIASGSTDGTVRMWEVETGRCLKVWQFDEAIKCVAWNPLSRLPILAVAVGRDLVLLNTELGSDEEQETIKEMLHSGNIPKPKASVAAIVTWLPDELYGGIKLRHFKNVSSINWHPKGDFFSTVMKSGETRGVVWHQLSKKKTEKPRFKIRGLPVCTLFHPSRSYFFVATREDVRVYNLLTEGGAIKKLETGLREISSMAIHPGGDNLIVGSKEGKMCWFDMDLSSKPYKTLPAHPKDIANVAVHRSYPLFASCSEDSTAHVYHGMVYNDLNQNPLITPLKILRGHSYSNGGVLDCKFHPRQPWLFTAGADSVIKLYCH